MKMRSEKRELDKVYKRRDRYEIPDWQRQEVWDTPRKQALIDSILRGWRLPKFYFLVSTTNPPTYDVVDGQQRLATIFEFLDSELELSAETAEKFGGKTYKELAPEVSDQVDDFEIDFDEIQEASDVELMEFFQRLQSGLELNSSERLNAISSKLKDFCKRMSKHEFFKSRVAFADKRYAHFDVMAKVAALEVEGLSTGLRYEDVKGVFEAQSNFSDQSQVAKRIKSALDFLAKAIPVNSRALRSRSVTQSLITVICRLQNNDALKGHELKLGEFTAQFVNGLATEVEKGQQATDADFIDFQKSINANVRTGPVVRNRVLLRKLFDFDPDLLDRADESSIASVNFKSDIAAAAKDIRDLLFNINETYAAKQGVDLFKPTNKTAAAQNAIGEPIERFEQYKALIENMFFLFWEGPGSKIEARPESFLDIRTLRTDAEHDTDHGSEKEAAKKKLKHGEVFKKYSAATSPAVASPVRFTRLQLHLLIALKKDLTSILAALSV